MKIVKDNKKANKTCVYCNNHSGCNGDETKCTCGASVTE